MLLSFIRRLIGRRHFNKAVLLLGEPDGEIDVTPENVLILWKGLRNAGLSEAGLLLTLTEGGDFYYPAWDVSERLLAGTKHFAHGTEPPKTHYPPLVQRQSLRFWLSDNKGQHLDVVDFLLDLEELIKDNQEAMELSRELEAEHVYDYRVGELYYVYCDIMTFCEVILRRVHST